MNAWATIDKPESVNFADILSEEKLRSVQTKKENPVCFVVKNQDRSVVDANITAKEVVVEDDDTFNCGVGNQELKYLDNASEKSQVPLLFDDTQQGVSLSNDFENDMQEYGIRDNQDKEDVHHPLEKELISAASYSYKLRNSGKKVIKYDVVLENKNTHESWQTKKETSSPVYIFGKGIPCPEIMKLKENVVMSSTEESCKFAMKLKYAALSYSDFVSAYKQVTSIMKRLYEKANLIHRNLTECNILWHNGKCYFTDFNHFIKPSDETGFYLLQSGCVNITRFFGKRIGDIDPPEELFKFITGFHFGNKIVLEHMENLYRISPRVHHKPNVESLMTSILYPKKSRKVNHQRKIK